MGFRPSLEAQVLAFIIYDICIFFCCSKPSWSNKLKPERAFQGVMARPISLTSAWTFKESLVGLRSGSPTRPEIKKGSSLGSSSRLLSVWKESCRRISPLHSIAEYIRGKKCSADLKRRLVAECHAAGAGSAGIAAMRGNMSE